MKIEKRINYPLPQPPKNSFSEIRFFPQAKIPTREGINWEIDPYPQANKIEPDLEVFRKSHLDIISAYENAPDKARKAKVLDELALELIKDPKDCLSFYQMLREYEGINKGAFHNVFTDIRNKLPDHFRQNADLKIIEEMNSEKKLQNILNL